MADEKNDPATPQDQDLLETTLTRALELLESEPEFPQELLISLRDMAQKRYFSHASRIYQLLQPGEES